MKALFIILVMAFSTLAVNATTWEVTNSGMTFSPSSLSIHEGDSVNFVIASIHDALEVSQSTWDANGTTPLAGGFSVPFGGGKVFPDKLTVGTHYYVCTAHVSFGMKGTITVTSSSGVQSLQVSPVLHVYPNPAASTLNVQLADHPSGSDFTVSDLEGRDVLKGRLEGLQSQVDISMLRPGMYMIRIADEKKSGIRFIKTQD
jgi:plastocyanin